VTSSALIDGSHTVTASVIDPASNAGIQVQTLTIDTAAPAVAVRGGATALTNDATPQISGSADVAPGTIMTVTLAEETLPGVVEADGSWFVTAAALADGPHRVIMSVSDASGNPASFTQTLTVDTVSPAVTITGGATATTSDLRPTIAGTADAAPGTTITVSIAGRTMTTLLQANGTWNATPSSIGQGAWAIVASAPDPAGNVGRARQTLTIGLIADTPAVPDRGSFNATDETTVSRDGSQKITGSSLSIGTTVTAPAGGRVVATGTGIVKIQGMKKAIKLTRKTVAVAAGQRMTLKLSPKGTRKSTRAAVARITRAVRAHKQVTATITLQIVDAAGNTRTVTRIVKLT
jgi:hypothetical protein